MPTDCITYQKSGYFSKLIVDYLDEKSEIQSLYHRFPTLENFASQIDEKAKNYSLKNIPFTGNGRSATNGLLKKFRNSSLK